MDSFIQTVFLKELREMVYDHPLLYLAVGNIAMGIELLGACDDAKPFNEGGLSEKRFRAGMSSFMEKINSGYAALNKKGDPHDLYAHVRCGMAHVMRPKGGFAVIGRAGAKAAGHSHLSNIPGESKILLIVEDFYDDFEAACKLLISALPSKLDPKFTSVFLPVSELAVLSPSSGSSETASLSG